MLASQSPSHFARVCVCVCVCVFVCVRETKGPSAGCPYAEMEKAFRANVPGFSQELWEQNAFYVLNYVLLSRSDTTSCTIRVSSQHNVSPQPPRLLQSIDKTVRNRPAQNLQELWEQNAFYVSPQPPSAEFTASLVRPMRAHVAMY
jgi:hypothetical protein